MKKLLLVFGFFLILFPQNIIKAQPDIKEAKIRLEKLSDFRTNTMLESFSTRAALSMRIRQETPIIFHSVSLMTKQESLFP